MTNTGKRPNFGRRKYLINRKFQLKWTLIITLAGGLSAAVFGALLWQAIAEQNVLIQDDSKTELKLWKKSRDVVVLLLNLPNNTPKETAKYKEDYKSLRADFEKSKAANEALIASNSRLRFWIIPAVLALTLVLFVWGVFLTHRVAGPLFVMTRYFKELNETGHTDVRPLRKNDSFQSMHGVLCELIENGSFVGTRDEYLSGDSTEEGDG
jgi:hypothetical protein